MIYLPFQGAIEALERAGNWSLGVLLLLSAAAPPLLLLALPRATFRDLARRTVRSYSKRLMLVYILLLLIPLLFLYFVLVRSMEERLRRDQRADGRRGGLELGAAAPRPAAPHHAPRLRRRHRLR